MSHFLQLHLYAKFGPLVIFSVEDQNKYNLNSMNDSLLNHKCAFKLSKMVLIHFN